MPQADNPLDGRGAPDVFAAIRTLLVEHLGIEADQIEPDAVLIDDLGGDSLDAFEIVMAIEARFGIDIPDAEMDALITNQGATVQSLVDLVVAKREGR